MAHSAPIIEVFLDETAPAEVAAAVAEAGLRVHQVGTEVISLIADTSTPQGVVAVVKMPTATFEDLAEDADLIVVLAGVRDPGNAGTLLRSALATGADAVVFGTASVDPFHPKTVRAAAGAIFDIPVLRGTETLAAVEALKGRGFAAYGAAAGSPTAMGDVDLSGRVALILGNEAAGLPQDIIEVLDAEISIPMPGPVESLNVGIAGAVLMFEAVRQRGTGNLPRP